MKKRSLIIFCLIVIKGWCGQQKSEKQEYSAAKHTIKAYGSVELGYYYINLFIGSPPQVQSLLLDTGSHITTFPCGNCKQCGQHQYPHFNSTLSSSYKPVECNSQQLNYKCSNCINNNQCGYEIQYTEGSTLQGTYSIDKAIFSDLLEQVILHKRAFANFSLSSPFLQQYVSNNQVQIMFGCTTQETNLFLNQMANGIMGLGCNSNTWNYQPNLGDYDYTFQIHGGEQLGFAVCYGTKDGYFTFNGNNPTHHLANAYPLTLSYSPLEDQYALSLHSLQIVYPPHINPPLMSQQIALSTSSAILDTGTTLTYFSNDNYNALFSLFHNYCANHTNCLSTQHQLPCFSVPPQNLTQLFHTLPQLHFIFSKDSTQKLVWLPKDYIYYQPNEEDRSKDSYCLAFREYEGDKTLLGAAFIRNHEVYFDRQKQQIQIIKADCDKENDSDQLFEFFEEVLAPNLNNTLQQKKNDIDSDQKLNQYYEDMKQLTKGKNQKFIQLIDVLDIKTNNTIQQMNKNRLQEVYIQKIDFLNNKYVIYIFVIIILMLFIIMIYYREQNKKNLIVIQGYQMQQSIQLQINETSQQFDEEGELNQLRN